MRSNKTSIARILKAPTSLQKNNTHNNLPTQLYPH